MTTPTTNLHYLKGFFEACYGQKQSVTFDTDKVADILDRINAAIAETQVIPAIQPIQIPLFPQVPFTPYKPQPGTIPFYPVQPTITPNDLPSWPQWTGISDEGKYRWIDDSRKTTCETIGDGIINPKCLDLMDCAGYNDPLPTVSADKLAAIMRDETRAQKLEERRARSDERTKNWNRPEPGRARD